MFIFHPLWAIFVIIIMVCFHIADRVEKSRLIEMGHAVMNSKERPQYGPNYFSNVAWTLLVIAVVVGFFI